jgi:sulfate adenylyltransferase
VNVGFAAFYESLGRVDLMENHAEEKPVFISGKAIREMLQNGDPIDPRVMRESTAAILSESMKT